MAKPIPGGTGYTMTNYDDTDQMISEFHELLVAEQERDPNFGWDTSKRRFEPEEPTAQPRELPTAPQIRPLAEVEERPISWLWPGGRRGQLFRVEPFRPAGRGGRVARMREIFDSRPNRLPPANVEKELAGTGVEISVLL